MSLPSFLFFRQPNLVQTCHLMNSSEQDSCVQPFPCRCHHPPKHRCSQGLCTHEQGPGLLLPMLSRSHYIQTQWGFLHFLPRRGRRAHTGWFHIVCAVHCKLDILGHLSPVHPGMALGTFQTLISDETI